MLLWTRKKNKLKVSSPHLRTGLRRCRALSCPVMLESRPNYDPVSPLDTLDTLGTLDPSKTELHRLCHVESALDFFPNSDYETQYLIHFSTYC